jgi:hypothetical protein
LEIAGIIHNVFRPQQTLQKTRIQLYNTLALPAVSHDRENWTIRATGAIRITAPEIKYMTRIARYRWTDYKTNTDCEGIKYNPSLGQNTAIQKKVATTCKENAS